jgi:hypothetical protein
MGGLSGRRRSGTVACVLWVGWWDGDVWGGSGGSGTGLGQRYSPTVPPVRGAGPLDQSAQGESNALEIKSGRVRVTAFCSGHAPIRVIANINPRGISSRRAGLTSSRCSRSGSDVGTRATHDGRARLAARQLSPLARGLV